MQAIFKTFKKAVFSFGGNGPRFPLSVPAINMLDKVKLKPAQRQSVMPNCHRRTRLFFVVQDSETGRLVWWVCYLPNLVWPKGNRRKRWLAALDPAFDIQNSTPFGFRQHFFILKRLAKLL